MYQFVFFATLMFALFLVRNDVVCIHGGHNFKKKTPRHPELVPTTWQGGAAATAWQQKASILRGNDEAVI